MEMHAFGRLLPVEIARRRLFAAARPVERSENVPLEAAFGRVSSIAFGPPATYPSFARATWDGYALRSADTRSARKARPAVLRLVGEAYAEGGFAGPVDPGEAVAIATGAAVPSGANSVVIFEEVERDAGTIRVPRPIRSGDRISPVGDDFARGALLVRRGEPLSPGALGALAACGVSDGSGLRETGRCDRPERQRAPCPRGAAQARRKIYESNNATLSAVVTASGGIPRRVRAVSGRPGPDRADPPLRAPLGRSRARNGRQLRGGAGLPAEDPSAPWHASLPRHRGAAGEADAGSEVRSEAGHRAARTPHLVPVEHVLARAACPSAAGAPTGTRLDRRLGDPREGGRLPFPRPLHGRTPRAPRGAGLSDLSGFVGRDEHGRRYRVRTAPSRASRASGRHTASGLRVERPARGRYSMLPGLGNG